MRYIIIHMYGYTYATCKVHQIIIRSSSFRLLFVSFQLFNISHGNFETTTYPKVFFFRDSFFLVVVFLFFVELKLSDFTEAQTCQFLRVKD